MEIRKLTSLTFISWALLACSVSSQTWDCTGWFGSPCLYKCRCTNNNCDENGTCISGATCQGGWFGPACQYADLAYGRTTDTRITDGDDNTCTSSSLGAVRIALDNSYQFTWMRVHVNSAKYLQSWTVIFNDSSLSCINPRNATVDNTTLDIYCDLPDLVQSVTLAGEGVQYLCSVYISGGRNVALRQNTTQSTTYSENSTNTGWVNKSYPSYLSVDGNTNGDFYIGNTCSITRADYNDFTHNWNVTFSQPRRVNRYIIYNRTVMYVLHLEGFTLQSFDATGTRVFSYTDTPVYEVPPDMYIMTTVNTKLPVSLVHITPDLRISNYLIMCEVEVYGESACEPGKYGRECEQTCNCAGGQTCFISTGGCPSGCATGFYGESCDLLCKSDTYGEGCKASCSEFFCAKNTGDERSCDRFSGTCLRGCQIGYMGPTCTTPCQPGFYGPRCTSPCSQHCVSNPSDDRACDHVDGTCLSGCQSGYQEPTCTAPCGRGRYGPGCSSSCSQFCVDTNKPDDSVCDHISGVCSFGCPDGHQAVFCEKDTSDNPGHETTTTTTGVNSKVIAAVVGSIAGAVVVALIVGLLAVILFMRRRRNTKAEVSQVPVREVDESDTHIYVEAIDVQSVIYEEPVNIQSAESNAKQAVYENTVTWEV